MFGDFELFGVAQLLELQRRNYRSGLTKSRYRQCELNPIFIQIEIFNAEIGIEANERFNSFGVV